MNFLPELIIPMEDASSSVKVYLHGRLEESSLKLFSSLCEQGKVIDLLLSEKTLKGLKKDGMSFLKLHQVWNAGVNIYTTEQEIPNCEFAIMLDYDRLITKWKTSDEHERHDSGSEVFYGFLKQFSDSKFSPEFSGEADDVHVFFEVENARVFRNSATVIRWEVKNAKETNISGIGEVAPKGEQTITLLKDTVLVLSATNGFQERSKSIAIHIIKELKIDYDLEFLNSASKEFCSLKKEDASHVYGVHRSNKLKLSWNIPEAEEVLIEPFGLTSKSGSKQFLPDGLLKLRLSAWVQGRKKTLDLVVQEYPIDLLYDRFIEIEKEFLPSIQMNSINYASKLTSFLAEERARNASAELQEIKSQAEDRVKRLYKELGEFSFDKVYQEHDPQSLGKMTQRRLRSYFKDKPSVLKMLESIRTYYR